MENTNGYLERETEKPMGSFRGRYGNEGDSHSMWSTAKTREEDKPERPTKPERLIGCLERLERTYRYKKELFAPRLITAALKTEGVIIRAGADGDWETYEYSPADVRDVVDRLVKQDDVNLYERIAARHALDEAAKSGM